MPPRKSPISSRKVLNEDIIARAGIVGAIRAFFDSQGFIEVDTPVRIAAPAPEPNIDCPPCGGKFLRASPELQMKKLLAQGMEKIYQIGPCFRNGENGSRHNDEFTMIEWYRKDCDDADIMRDAAELLNHLGVKSEPEVLSVRDAYRKFAGWDPFEVFDHDRFDFDMSEKIEPNLDGWTFLSGYPPECASLAKIEAGIAQRWELYFGSLEIANCFTELCDESEQRMRFAAAREQRRRLGEADYPLDEEFLASLPLIGSAAGVALGIDRLVMALLGKSTIAQARIL